MPWGLLVLGIIVLIIFIACIRIVPHANVYVLEVLGKYKASWQSGIHIMPPFVSRIANRVTLKERVGDFPPQPVITKDNVTMKIDTVVYFRVFDPKLYTYGVENPINALENLTATTLRNIIGELELDETLTSRDTINAKMQGILDVATDAWGIKVNRVELKNIIPPKEIQDAMEKQMKAEREKRQTLLEADAHKQASITRAQGDREATVLRAEAERDAAIARAKGEAESIRLVYEAEANGLKMLSSVEMTEAAVLMKKLEALKEMGDGQATKIVVPTDLASSASNLEYTREMLLGKQPAVRPASANPKKDDACCPPGERSAVTAEFSQE